MNSNQYCVDGQGTNEGKRNEKKREEKKTSFMESLSKKFFLIYRNKFKICKTLTSFQI